MIETNVDNIIPDMGYMIFRRCTPMWRLDQQTISFCDITYVIEGSSQYTINNVKYLLKAGDILCLPEGSTRAAISFPNDLMSCYSINFQLTDLAGASVKMPFHVYNHIGLRGDVTLLFHELSLIWTSEAPGFRMKARGLLLLIFNKIMELTIYKTHPTVADPRVKRAARFITENYGRRITVKELADMAGLNTVYFGALFKKETGVDVIKYITQVRINCAENMLQKEGCSVSEAAARCGYRDISHFHKRFKMIKGYSPSLCLLNKKDNW